MRTFRCQVCGQALFFENVSCLRCGSTLAFLPDALVLAAIEEAGEPGLWRPKARRGRPTACSRVRLCANRSGGLACNFAVPGEDRNPLCACCRLTRVLPDLSHAGNLERWARIEVAKRRLFYSLARLGLLDPTPAAGTSDGPVFEFLEDLPGQPVSTGHANGVITLNVSEADDDERVRRRLELHEPYRTLLGHFRHESGHYYWDKLIEERGRHDGFREVFGDERANYAEALQKHYASGGWPQGWEEHHVSAYSTAHPWEDWAETWAHYLHMLDLLETAAAFNTRITLPGEGDEELEELTNPYECGAPDFETLVEQWVPITLLVNSLNRSLGQEDAYPFALSGGALRKLRFVHEVIQEERQAQEASPA